ncbi:unnamed protein product [Mytilus edulis]|uniref:Uncharacterized protein n=1 Tax=Mytilus edulis TaxID=6550 RepID=A0A8S3SEN4_MYTED|nr:unnamed protein product [Mytilus edulis]
MNNYLVLIHKERFLKGLQTKRNVVSLLMLFNFNLLKYYLVNICINNSGSLLKEINKEMARKYIKCVVVCYGLKDDINVSQIFNKKDDAKRLFESSKNERWLYVLNYSRTEHTNKEPETEDMIDGEFGDIKHRNVAVEMAEMEFAEDEGHFQY